MRLRPLHVLALAAVAAQARGAERDRAELRAALMRLERAAPAERAADGASLSSVLAALERRDQAQRLQFAAAASRALPPKAAARLAAARAAYDAGQGRLLALLRPLAGGGARNGPSRAAAAAPEALREARAILRTLDEAARAEPTSAEVKLRAPAIKAGALVGSSSSAGSTGGSAAGAPFGSVPQTLQDAAAALPGPIDVYEWVRDTIAPEFYQGTLKGPVETFLERSGNDADTNALLVALLRAKGVPARFVRGTVEVPGGVLAAVTGTETAADAVRVLERAGIPHEVVLGAGGVASVKLARVWCEAYLPYVDYRGAPLGTQGKFWIPLDAGFKRLHAPTGIDLVRELGFDARAALDTYLAQPRSETPLEFVRAQASALVAQRQPGTAYDALLDHRDFARSGLGLLPNSLPYKLVARDDVSDELPEELRHTVRVVGDADGTTILDATLALADVLGRRVTLSYAPFSADDEQVVALYGSIPRTPPYLIDLKAILKVSGVPVAGGDAPIGAGVKFRLRLDLGTPGGTETVTNTVLAGNLTAIGLGGRVVTASDEDESEAARILAGLAWKYLDRWNEADAEFASLFHVVPVRPTASACFVMSDVEVDYAGGDPRYPTTFEWKGIAIDADLRSSAPAGVSGRDNEVPFLLMSGLQGSILENRIFEDDLKIPSVSTATALALAAAEGIEVLNVDAGTVDALDTLPLDPGVVDEIREAVGRGLTARVPASPVTSLAWTGVGYLLLDAETGEAAYQLQGGHSGGVTAAALIDIPSDVKDTLVEQGEKPNLLDTIDDVARVQKYATTDLQFGTVDTLLKKPFKVLVTDRDGQPVAHVPVVFRVVGGGGTLQDVDNLSRGPTVTVTTCTLNDSTKGCKGLKAGEAAVLLRLGQHTGDIPRFMCEPGYDCEHGDMATQVGLNAVAVQAGNATLPDPFTAFGLPDDQFDGTSRHATLGFATTLSGSWAAILSVPNSVQITVSDPLGNPLSNIGVRFAYRPDPVPIDTPPGQSRERDATKTPGHVLAPADFLRCHEEEPSVIWGQCEGEAETIVVKSSPVGATAYPVLGDSPYSIYYFDVGTAENPTQAWFRFPTQGLLCIFPDPAQCGAANVAQPQFFVTEGTRFVLANALGNPVEGYPLGASAPMRFWADLVYEDHKVQWEIDGARRIHYRVAGTNVWKRKHLSDSTFDLTPGTPGTVATPAQATSRGDGQYDATMIVANVPQQNTVTFDVKSYPELFAFMPGTAYEVDPATVTPGTGTPTADWSDCADCVAKQTKDPKRPWEDFGAFSVWGVDFGITEIKPSPISLSAQSTTEKETVAKYHVDPPEYAQLLALGDVSFQLSKKGKPLAGASGSAAQEFRVPVGLSLVPGPYDADMTVAFVRDRDGTPIHSQATEVTACSLLALANDRVELALVQDTINGTTCGEDGKIVFDLCAAADVTITVDGAPLQARVDDALSPAPVTAMRLLTGRHVVWLPPAFLGTATAEEVPFTVRAVKADDPASTGTAKGVIVDAVQNRSVLPVGHTFVKGVDLFDGHVVQQATDLRLPGRHLGLEMTRTYSSAGQSASGATGAGWSWSYGSSVGVADCGLVTVTTADGSTQVFRSTDNGQTFRPQRGYHGSLVRNGDLSYDFIDKSHTRHHFKEPDDPAHPNGPRRLEYVEEPHGDRTVLTYDGQGRVSHVGEVHPESGEVRGIEITYREKQAGGLDRIAKAAIPQLNLEVDYDYDEQFGNLTTVTRLGHNLPGGEEALDQTTHYDYATSDPRDRHQLVGVTDANDNRTEYLYYTLDDVFPGGDAIQVESKREYAKAVREFPETGNRSSFQDTQFVYDYTEALQVRFKTTVHDARGNDTLYVLNGNGSPLEIHEPLGKTTVMEWSPTDVFKTSETDALQRRTEYGHDDRGNLTSETIRTDDLGGVTTIYGYDPTFNKLSFKRDAEGRETRYTIDPQTGDLDATIDAVGNTTIYSYDAQRHGLLTSSTDPRGDVTHYESYDSFGNALLTVDPLGNTTFRSHDDRGRLRSQTDTFGHETHTSYDAFDRPRVVERVAGAGSANEVTITNYDRGGRVASVTNSRGATTAFTRDGLDRVRGTLTTGPDLVPLTTRADYDGNGNKTFEIDRRGVWKRNTYDALNRLTQVEIQAGPAPGPRGRIATFGYDLVGNKRSETDVAGLETDFDLDGLYRVAFKRLPESGPNGRYFEQYEYDRVGNRTLVRDANGNPTQFGYDGLNRVTSTKNALGEIVTETYDDPGGSHVDRSEEADLTRGVRTTFAYDALNRETDRVVHLEGAGSNGEVYKTHTDYADPQHVTTVTDPRGHRTQVTLDGLDKPVLQIVDVGGLALTTQTAYDGLGNKTSVVDPRGHTTIYDYDSLGRLTSVTDALHHHTIRTYDGEGLKLSEVDRRDVEKDFSYDNLGRPLTETIVPSKSGVRWRHQTVYDDVGRTRTSIDARDHRTIARLDGLGRVVTVTDPLGHQAITTWDGVNKRVEIDKRGHATKHDYDALNRLVTTTDPAPFDGQRDTIAYDDPGNRRTETDRRHTAKVTQTDPLGRVLTVTRAGIVLETNRYDENGNKVSGKDAVGKETRFAFDGANRLSSRTDGFGSPDEAVTRFDYDENGNQTSELDPRAAAAGLAFSIKKDYDELDRLTAVTDGASHVTRYDYDAEGNRTSLREPLGQTTVYDYDELGKLTLVLQPAVAGGVPATRYGYDENRNQTTQIDANGHRVVMAYDELDRLRTYSQEDGARTLVTKHDYDENGNETSLVDPNGHSAASAYDELNRLKSKTYTAPPPELALQWRHTTAIGYTYDENGNVTVADESVASGNDPPAVLETIRDYDALDRLKSETQPLPDGGVRKVSYSYFDNGTRESVTDPSGAVTAYTYDGQNRLATATLDAGTPQAAVTRYGYFPDDLLHTVGYPNGVVATYAYDDADRLTSLVNAKGASVLSSYGYGYDDNGNRLSQLETNGGVTEGTSYGYDALDRLASVTYPADAAFPNGRVVTYTYDLVGNRTGETTTAPDGTVLAQKQGFFDSFNRLTRLDDLVDPSQSTTFGWDGNGNQISKTTAGVTTTYVYDCRDKLIESNQGAGNLGRFQYDYQGRRSKKIGAEGIRDYVYDQTSTLAEYDDAGALVAKYDYGSDRLISLFRRDEPRRFYSFDGLRSITNLTDDAGSAVASYHLDAWGNYRFNDELAASRNRFGFTGYLWDEETKLYFAKARFYDPETARFTTQDSYLGQVDEPPSLHRYAYGNDNPLRYIDPTGHAPEDAAGRRKEESPGEMWDRIYAERARAGEQAEPTSEQAKHDAAPRMATEEGKSWWDRAKNQLRKAKDATASAYDAARNGAAKWLGDHGYNQVAGWLKPSEHGAFSARQKAYYEASTPEERQRQGDPSAPDIAGAIRETAAEGTRRVAEEGYKAAFDTTATEVGIGAAGAVVTRGKNAFRALAREAETGGELAATERTLWRGGEAATVAQEGDAAAASGPSAGRFSRPTDSQFYESGFEARLKRGVDYPGVSDARHFQEANRQLYEAMKADPQLAIQMEQLYPGITKGVAPGPRGAFPRTRPTPDVTWHHNPKEGVLELIPRAHHRAPGPVQRSLHPGGEGGMEIWGGGRDK